MINNLRKFYWIPILLVSLVSGCVAPQMLPIADGGAMGDDLAEVGEFLVENYDIALDGEVSQGDYYAALDSIMAGAGEVELPAEIDQEGFTLLEAILTTVHMVNMDELGYTYPDEKVGETLAGWSGVPEGLATERRQELAAAIDGGLVGTSWKTADLSGAVTAESGTTLLGNALLLSGNYKDFLGRSTDADIVNKLHYTWQSFDQVLMPELQNSANALIEEGVITGYNIKRLSHRAGASQSRTLVYGHSDMAHARQLIGLLRSEGLEADIMLEPKTSAFLYLDEWGEPSESPGFVVEPLDGGNGIAYAKEYDLVFEFDDIADRDQFDQVIKQYAKKNEQDQPGLIIGSWWQPLYSSRVALSDYILVKNNVVTNSQFYIQSFSLEENSPAVAEAFQSAYPDAEVETHDLWVNEAFHNYLLGEAQ